MKLMSFNCRGLAGPGKKSALMRVLSLEHPDVLMLQETLGVGEVIQGKLESWFPGWSFVTLDANGRSGGLAVGWKNICVKMLNAWGSEAVLGVDLLFEDLGISLSVLNIYGPYINRAPFWESLFQNPMANGDSVVLGGDLNFSMGLTEVWGSNAQADSLARFFVHKLMMQGLLDIEPVKLKPTWRNKRCGNARVAKRIDRFLVAERLVDSLFLVRQWVGSGGLSDHFPIFLEVKKGPINPPSPLKFNKSWLKEESFKHLFLSHWIPFGRDNDRSAALQFADNIKRLKVFIKEWAAAKRTRDEAELKSIEDALLLLYEGDGGVFFLLSLKRS